ncbi:MAG: hypothetical protein CVV23_00870 [Ignavibacteriae bacterium HGW-Ignavibacteriae-2]|nr:MAG: hypothetical protein CVV23_00870 [Ignavibacteriae bacterium HGW-Ignavibacteriae-2]
MTLDKAAEIKIKEYLDSIKLNNYSTSSISKRQYNYEFEVTKSTGKIKVQLYFGKKGLKTVIQGNSESELFQEIHTLLSDQPKLDFPQKEEIEFDEYIGSDETGKGDLFGPLVVCAFFCGKKDSLELQNIGVRDSKDLSPNQIETIAGIIKHKFKDNYYIVIITPEKYNRIYQKFNNLNKLLNSAHTEAIDNLLKVHDCKNFIIDKFSNEKVILNNGLGEGHNIKLTHKAERFSGVAAASILARFTFDNWFKNHTKFDLPKGASQKTVETAQKIFDDYGLDELNKVAKLHFKSIKNLV